MDYLAIYVGDSWADYFLLLLSFESFTKENRKKATRSFNIPKKKLEFICVTFTEWSNKKICVGPKWLCWRGSSAVFDRGHAGMSSCRLSPCSY